MAGPDTLGLDTADLGTGYGLLDGLVADGQAIGVRVVLDLSTAPALHVNDPAPVVDVPDSAASLLTDFSSYGS